MASEGSKVPRWGNDYLVEGLGCFEMGECVVEEKESGKGGPFYGLRTQVSHAPASTPERAMTWRLPV